MMKAALYRHLPWLLSLPLVMLMVFNFVNYTSEVRGDQKVVLILAQELKNYMEKTHEQYGVYPQQLRDVDFLPVEGVQVFYRGDSQTYSIAIRAPYASILVTDEGFYSIDQNPIKLSEGF